MVEDKATTIVMDRVKDKEIAVEMGKIVAEATSSIYLLSVKKQGIL
jgi:hypothetical protein